MQKMKMGTTGIPPGRPDPAKKGDVSFVSVAKDGELILTCSGSGEGNCEVTLRKKPPPGIGAGDPFDVGTETPDCGEESETEVLST